MPRPSWTVRPKGERDVTAVVALLADVAREGNWIATEWPFDLDARAAAQRDALLHRYTVGWVAVERRVIVGDLTLWELGRDEPELGMIVAAAHRRRGIGRALLERAIAWAEANAKTALLLRVFPDNEAARALYRGCGFVDVEIQRKAISRRDGSRRDAVLMRRPTAETRRE
ncbi:MAG: GNAT family N-acetyltransferase [Candidatus Eremiobacteraeota bacterium]|nr:GNAT family N-acetyltransferase [Candidatus Eremiobacteraeota bacterium]